MLVEDKAITLFVGHVIIGFDYLICLFRSYSLQLFIFAQCIFYKTAIHYNKTDSVLTRLLSSYRKRLHGSNYVLE